MDFSSRGDTVRHSLGEAGFGAPADYWLAHDLREMTDDLLHESNIRGRGLFEPKAVRALVDEHRNGRHDWSLQI